MKFIEENDGPIFDFCYIDGAHDWYNDGFAFLLVDKLLKPGGMIIFDDYNWSFGSSPSMQESPKVLAMSDEEREVPHIKKVFEVLVKTHPDYHNFRISEDGLWAIAEKKDVNSLKKKDKTSFLKKHFKL